MFNKYEALGEIRTGKGDRSSRRKPASVPLCSHKSHRITHSFTELSPSSETNCAATQELPSVLCNPKAHYRVHKSPPLVPILSQINLIHTIPSYLSKIRFKYCPPTYALVFLVVSFLLAFPPISYMHSSSPHSCYLPCPSHPCWRDHSNYTWRRVQVMKLLIM
jgi:hypothetical protein